MANKPYEKFKQFGASALSNEELLSIAEESGSKKTNGIIDLIFGLSDLSTVALLFLPLFALRQSNAVYDVSLIELNSISL